MKQKLFTLLTLALFVCSGAWAGNAVTWTPTSENVATLVGKNKITVGSGTATFDVWAVRALVDASNTPSISYDGGVKIGDGSIKKGGVAIYLPSTVDDIESIEFYLKTSNTRKTYYASGSSCPDSGTETGSALEKTFTAYDFWSSSYNKNYYYCVGGKTSGSGDVYIEKIVVTFADAAPTHTVTLNKGEGTTGGSAKATEGSTKLTITTAPVYADHAIVGYYKEAGLETLVADASGNLQASTGYTNASSEWTSEADDITLYTKWRAIETFCSLAPATSGDAPTAKNQKINMQAGGYGGAIYTAGAKSDAWSSAFAYTSNGLGLQTGGADSVRVELNDYLKEGSVISLTLVSGGTTVRGLNLLTTTKSSVASLGWTEAPALNDEATFTYTVTSSSALKDKKQFLLQRNNTVYLKSLTVTECQPGGIITASGYNTYSSSKALDLSTLSAGTTAYVATAVSGGKIVLTKTTAKVPAETGLFLAGTANQKFTVDIATGGTSAPAVNLLVAAPDGTTVTDAESGYYNYVFGWSDAANPGFYLISGTDAKLGAGKAYLHTSAALDAPEGRGGFIFEDENTTGIAEVSTKKAFNGDFYNLSGQKVSQPTKGLYIVNGKKVIIK